MTTAAALVGHPDAAQQVAQVALDIARAARMEAREKSAECAGGRAGRGERDDECRRGRRRAGRTGDESGAAARPSCSGCTWSASGEPACRASPASCWTGAAMVSGSDAKESRGVLALRARGA